MARTVTDEPQQGRAVGEEPASRVDRPQQRYDAPRPDRRCDHRPGGACWPERGERPEGGAAWA